MSGERSGHSNKWVAQVVEDEGLGHAIMDYLGADMIADPQLAKLWKEAGDVLKKIQHILDQATEAEEGD